MANITVVIFSWHCGGGEEKKSYRKRTEKITLFSYTREVNMCSEKRRSIRWKECITHGIYHIPCSSSIRSDAPFQEKASRDKWPHRRTGTNRSKTNFIRVASFLKEVQNTAGYAGDALDSLHCILPGLVPQTCNCFHCRFKWGNKAAAALCRGISLKEGEKGNAGLDHLLFFILILQLRLAITKLKKRK